MKTIIFKSKHYLKLQIIKGRREIINKEHKFYI